MKSNFNWLEHKGGEEVEPLRFAATIAWPHLWSTLHCSTTTLKLFFLFRLLIKLKGLWPFRVLFSTGSGTTSVIRKDNHKAIRWTKHGLLNRWTDIFFLPRTAWGGPFNPNNATQTHSIFVKLSENTFLGMPKVRALAIFTLSMP